MAIIRPELLDRDPRKDFKLCEMSLDELAERAATSPDLRRWLRDRYFEEWPTFEKTTQVSRTSWAWQKPKNRSFKHRYAACLGSWDPFDKWKGRQHRIPKPRELDAEIAQALRSPALLLWASINFVEDDEANDREAREALARFRIVYGMHSAMLFDWREVEYQEQLVRLHLLRTVRRKLGDVAGFAVFTLSTAALSGLLLSVGLLGHVSAYGIVWFLVLGFFSWGFLNGAVESWRSYTELKNIMRKRQNTPIMDLWPGMGQHCDVEVDVQRWAYV